MTTPTRLLLKDYHGLPETTHRHASGEHGGGGAVEMKSFDGAHPIEEQRDDVNFTRLRGNSQLVESEESGVGAIQ